MTVRAIYRAVALPGKEPPYDRALLKIYYAARHLGTDEERNSGVVLPDTDFPPGPVVIILPGINIASQAYGWLARALAAKGAVAVTFELVAEEMPGYVSLTPGLSIADLAPDAYGKRPSATAIGPILNHLAEINEKGLLAGRLNLDRVVLGGHSAGGSVALLNARPDWFPGVSAAFCYGAHTGAATGLGYPEDSFFETPSQVPLLIMGGTRDGCIAMSATRYGDSQGSATERVERTFDEAIRSDRGDAYLAIIEGANHFSMAYPVDDATGRRFVDLSTSAPDASIRRLLRELVVNFVLAYASDHRASLRRLKKLLAPDQALLRRSAIR